MSAPTVGARAFARARHRFRRSPAGAALAGVAGSVGQWRDGNSETPLRLVREIYREHRGGVR